MAEAPLRALTNRPVGTSGHTSSDAYGLSARITHLSEPPVRSLSGSVDWYLGPIAKTAYATRQARDNSVA